MYYILKCFNDYATIERRFSKYDLLKLKACAKKICTEQNMKYTYETHFE